MAHSTGDGTFRDDTSEGDDADGAGGGAGTLESTLTTLHPYARLVLSEKVSVWGILGYGTGDLTLEIEGAGRRSTPTEMQMAAAGARAVLVPAPEGGGFELGYGLRALRGLGTITPYTGLTLSDGAGRTWRAGVLWTVSDATSMSLEGAREERGGNEAGANAVLLRASVRF